MSATDESGYRREAAELHSSALDALRRLDQLLSIGTTFITTVAVRTIGRYNREVAGLARTVSDERPATLGRVDVYPEIYSGQVECPRVRVEVGPRGKPDTAALAWVQILEGKYGSGRVAKRYLAVAKPD
jgi:hypothetical protein